MESADQITEIYCIEGSYQIPLQEAVTLLLRAGAVDAFCVAMPSRCDYSLHALCHTGKKDQVLRAFRQVTSSDLFIRFHDRQILLRESETLQTVLGAVRKKTANYHGVEKHKWEFDDIKEISDETGLPLRSVKDKIS